MAKLYAPSDQFLAHVRFQEAYLQYTTCLNLISRELSALYPQLRGDAAFAAHGTTITSIGFSNIFQRK